jgi:hypothetical protein
MRIVPFCLLFAALASCSDSGVSGGPRADGGTAADGGASNDAGVSCPAGGGSIAVTPPMPTLTITSATPPQQQFSAQGRLGDGGLVPITVAWSVTRADDGPVGSIDGNGLYTADPNGGGVVTVHADAGGCSGTATLEIRVDREAIAPGAPADAPTVFAGTPAVDAARTPVVVYPSDATRFPRNVFDILFQWRKAQNDLFRLDFSGPHGRVRVYTDGAHMLCANATPAAGCWEAPDDVWSWIASTNAGEEVQLKVAGALRAQPGTFYESGPLRIAFSRRDVRGVIFYWSTTSAGIRRSSVSNLPSDDYLVKGQTVSGTTVACAACHTVSRDGKRLGAYVNGNLWLLAVTPTAPPPAILTGLPGPAPKRTWMTFAPDNTQIVVSSGGVLTRRDGTSGALLQNVSLPTGKYGTHPDWSPDWARIAITLSEDADSDNVSGSDIALVSFADGGTADTQVLVPRGTAAETNAYPSFSPDGRYVTFVRSARGTHGDTTAKLWLVGATGGGAARLDAANFVVNNATVPDTTNMENNMPTWAPRGDLDWIAFNSKRDYGVVAAGREQIWIAGVDLGRLDGGLDPSYPAFRLPFQDLAENNHRPFWALDIRRDLPDGGVPAQDGGVEDGGTCFTEGTACDQSLLQCCRGLYCGGPDADGGFVCGS